MTATGASVPRATQDVVPEPALRPAARGFPERYVVRRARVFLDRGDLVVRGPDRAEQRYPVGGRDGVSRAVLTVWTPGAAGTGSGSAGTGSGSAGVLDPLGVLELRDRSGRALLRLALSAWTPDAAEAADAAGPGSVRRAGPGSTGPRSALAGSDAAALLATAGIPVEPAGADSGPAGGGSAPAGGPAPIVAFRATLPSWFVAVRAAAVVLAAVTMLLAAAWTAQTRILLLVAACALLAVPLSGAAVVLRAWRLDRRDPVDRSLLLRPRPGGPVTRRFLRTAHARVQDGQLVLADGVGAERWLPLSGPVAVRAAATAGAAAGAGPDGPQVLVFGTRDGRPRAMLPWSDWFAGPGGADELARFAAGAGLDLSPAPSARAVRTAAGRGGPGVDPYRAADAYRCGSWREVREATATRSGLPGAASVYQPAALGALVALGAFLGTRQSVLAGSVAALAVLLSVLPPLASRLIGRWWLDVPARDPVHVPEER